MKKLWTKIRKTNKAVQTFLQTIIKSYKSMKCKIKKIWLSMFAISCSIGLASCGSTKVLVDKPAQGTQTTITVTTNNPISTEVNPNVEFNKK